MTGPRCAICGQPIRQVEVESPVDGSTRRVWLHPKGSDPFAPGMVHAAEPDDDELDE